MKFEFTWPSGFRGVFENVEGRMPESLVNYKLTHEP